MSTIVIDKTYDDSEAAFDTIKADITNVWNWKSVIDMSSGTKFLVCDGTNKVAFGIYKNTYSGSTYTAPCCWYNNASMQYAGPSSSGNKKLKMKFENINNRVLVISAWRFSTSSTDELSAGSCDKYIICKGVNAVTNTEDDVLIYCGNRTGNNAYYLLTSEWGTALSAAEMRAPTQSKSLSAKAAFLIPFYSNASEFYTPEVLQALTENLTAWDWGNVTINGQKYRMSGSIFVKDE